MEQPEPGHLDDLFEDLEQQAAGLELAERDAELLDRARGEYAAVTLSDRLHASVGRAVELTLRCGERLGGSLVAAGTDWCSLSVPGGTDTWLVRMPAIAFARGLSPRSLPEPVRPLVARLGFGSALHRAAEASPEIVARLSSGPPLHVRVRRVGADFLEVVDAGPGGTGTLGSALVLSFSALEAVRTREP